MHHDDARTRILRQLMHGEQPTAADITELIQTDAIAYLAFRAGVDLTLDTMKPQTIIPVGLPTTLTKVAAS